MSESLRKTIRAILFSASVLATILVFPPDATAQRPDIPEALKPWESWATWNDVERNSPAAYNNANDRINYWPSRLNLETGPRNGSWEIAVNVFADSWVAIPGGSEAWPMNVVGNGNPIAVVEREGYPAVKLAVGRHELSGEFAWDKMPQRIAIPRRIGLLNLVVDGQAVSLPSWDDTGHVWLRRQRIEPAEENSITVQVFRVIEDGIPTWLRTDIELTVSGKSREEEFGWILPEGWKLARVDSPIPVAVDSLGRMKAQVRAGKWTISVNAFRSTDTREIKFADVAQPITSLELVGFKSKPEFRLAEVTGLQAVDVTQTTFPQKWRGLPVFQWDTSTSIQIEEKMRGMGLQRPEGLAINRQFWLDENGKGLTYRDTVRGKMLQIWRLDTADGQQIGSVRVNGKGQLITSNPQTGSNGVEIRTRDLKMDAIGRIQNANQIPATGWQVDADSLGMTMSLPPGWRVFALFGADSVEGDWLTAWTLLDLFLLLIFSVAVFRMWGFPAGIVAFIAFGLAYHEPGAPRITWLFLLMPVALLRVVNEGTAKKWIVAWKYLAITLLVINLAPFLGGQIQNAIYPQLERPGINYSHRGMFWSLNRVYRSSVEMADYALEVQESSQTAAPAISGKKTRFDSSNLLYDPKARIQTGPAEPEWSWNQVQCRWSGPVSSSQTIKPILISLNQNRAITVVRIALLVLLVSILFGGKKMRLSFRFPLIARRTAVSIALVFACFGSSQLWAQDIPGETMLKTLRERLLQPADAFPRAAEIPRVQLSIVDNKIVMEAEVHTAAEVAVPLPGRIPAWSPLSVSVDGKPAELICRRKGYLWTVLPAGVNQVVVESLLPDVTEWEWTFLLKPRVVSIDAPGWNVSGVRSNGVPEQQVFFTQQRKATDEAAAYDRKDFQAIVAVDRHIETGLVWQVRNEVTRLTGSEKAVSIRVPLLEGENVLTSNVVVQDGMIEIRIGGGKKSFSWTSELPAGKDIQLVAPDTDQWIERWHLITSPVWNVNLSPTGLAPIFEPKQTSLIPVWHPWPKEEVTLAFSEPESVAGATVTVMRVNQRTVLGRRERTMQTKMTLECSLGGDFEIGIDPESEVSSVRVEGQPILVRRDGESVIVPVRPGRQVVEVAWRSEKDMQTVVQSGEIKLPVESANVTTVIRGLKDRWVLWSSGPTQGPAVRFWTILVFAILAALMLGSIKLSPLGRVEWVLLAIGLTQVHVAAALIVVAWLFLLAWRGRSDPPTMRRWVFNLRQVGIVLITLIAIGILIVVVGAGLLGSPEMFIIGNGSSPTNLQWFQARSGLLLPESSVISISVWYYRLLMLFWALWLATALLRWLTTGWKHFSHGGAWKHRPILAAAEVAVVESSEEDPNSQ